LQDTIPYRDKNRLYSAEVVLHNPEAAGVEIRVVAGVDIPEAGVAESCPEAVVQSPAAGVVHFAALAGVAALVAVAELPVGVFDFGRS